MTDAEITKRLDHLRGVHPKEPGARVGEVVSLLLEIQALRKQVQRRECVRGWLRKVARI